MYSGKTSGDHVAASIFRRWESWVSVKAAIEGRCLDNQSRRAEHLDWTPHTFMVAMVRVVAATASATVGREEMGDAGVP